MLLNKKKKINILRSIFILRLSLIHYTFPGKIKTIFCRFHSKYNAPTTIVATKLLFSNLVLTYLSFVISRKNFTFDITPWLFFSTIPTMQTILYLK